MEQEYFVQLFVEHNKSLKLPTVGELLEIMFKEQKIRFTKVPERFTKPKSFLRLSYTSVGAL